MANCSRRLWDYRSYLVIYLTPLLILPVPLIINTLEAKCGFVVILMAVYWCTECVPFAVTALLPVIFFPMMGIMKSEQVCPLYISDPTMLAVGGLFVAIAVEYWNLHKRLTMGILLLVGVRPALLMAGFMSITAFLSMFISSIASVAMMLPIIHDVLESCRRAEDAAQVQEEQQNAELVLSPEEVFRSEQRKLRNQQKHQNLTKGMSLSVCYAANIGGTATLTGATPNLLLKSQIDKLFPANGDVINYTSWLKFSFFNMVLMLATSYLWLHFMYFGLNVKKSFGSRAASNTAHEVRQLMRRKYRKLGGFGFAEGCVTFLFILLVVLWFTRDPEFMPGWAPLLFNQERKFVTDGTVSILVSIMFFVIPSKLPRVFCCHSGSFNLTGRATVNAAPKALLTWSVVQEKTPWNIMLLLGGAIALARGIDMSGLSGVITGVLEPLQNMNPVALSFTLCIVMAMLTEVCSNTMISTILLPILASMATTIGLHPLYLMVPPTICTSLAFMLPVASPTNAITFTYANLKIMDMVKPGLVLNVLGILCVNLAIHTWGAAMFQLDEFPVWANVSGSPTASPSPTLPPEVFL